MTAEGGKMILIVVDFRVSSEMQKHLISNLQQQRGSIRGGYIMGRLDFICCEYTLSIFKQQSIYSMWSISMCTYVPLKVVVPQVKYLWDR